jgi:hypothetical protein
MFILPLGLYFSARWVSCLCLFSVSVVVTFVNMALQGDQKVSVHLMIIIHYFAQSDCMAADRQGQGDTRLTPTPSVIPNSNYVIMVSD